MMNSPRELLQRINTCATRNRQYGCETEERQKRLTWDVDLTSKFAHPLHRTSIAVHRGREADGKGEEREKEQTWRKLKGSGFLKQNRTVGTAKELETADLAGMASVSGFGVGRPNNLRSGRCKRG